MTLGLLFWIIVVVALVFGLWGYRDARFAPYGTWPLFVLVVILGWAVFGAAVHR